LIGAEAVTVPVEITVRN